MTIQTEISSWMQLGNQGREAHLFNWQDFVFSGLAGKLNICFQGLTEPFSPHAEVTGGSDTAEWFNSNGCVLTLCGLTARTIPRDK